MIGRYKNTKTTTNKETKTEFVHHVNINTNECHIETDCCVVCVYNLIPTAVSVNTPESSRTK